MDAWQNIGQRKGLLKYMNNFKKRSKQAEQTAFIHELRTYTDDLQRYTLLRSKAMSDDEKARYTKIIECMQRVVIFLNESLEKTLAK